MWSLVFDGVEYDVIEVDGNGQVKAINLVKVKTIANLQIDSVVVLKKDGVDTFKGIVKKKASEDEIVYQYDINELASELSDYVLYEGLKVYDVSGQTLDGIVADVLNFTPSDGVPWTVDVVYEQVVGTSGSANLVIDNVDLVNGDLKFEVDDMVKFSGTPPGGLNTTTVYYVVVATETYIRVSTTEGGSVISVTSTKTCNIHHVIRYMSVYWGKRMNALYKVVTDICGMVLWFDSFNKKVGYGYKRVDRGDVTEKVYKRQPEEESYKKNYDRVIVLGSKDTIKGVAGDGSKVVVYKYEDAHSQEEAEDMAKMILKSVGKASKRMKFTVTPDVVINEGDVVTVDGEVYLVFDVKETYEEIVIGVGAIKQTVFDKFGEKLKEVTGEVGTGTNATYDGGLQNIGAPSVNCILSVDVTADTCTVADVELYYSNTNRIVFSSTGTVPSPLVAGTVYYVRDLNTTTDSFKVAATSGGTAINLTTNGSGIVRARNLDSQSIPAEFVINVPDVEKIGNLDYIADFSAYRDQMSVGDEVEFLSVPSIISDSAASGQEFLNRSPIYMPSSSGFTVTQGSTGFQFALVSYEMSISCDRRMNANFACVPQVSYDGGTTWISSMTIHEDVSWAGTYDYPSSTTRVAKGYALISGTNVKSSTVKIRMAILYGYTNYPGWTICTVKCQQVPRHNHIIDKQNNVIESTLAKNVKCYITNSQYTNQLVYTWSGTVNGEKQLTNLYTYLRDGQNILKFYSESPGSVYVSGTYESYGI